MTTKPTEEELEELLGRLVGMIAPGHENCDEDCNEYWLATEFELKLRNVIKAREQAAKREVLERLRDSGHTTHGSDDFEGLGQDFCCGCELCGDCVRVSGKLLDTELAKLDKELADEH